MLGTDGRLYDSDFDFDGDGKLNACTGQAFL